MCVDLVSYLIMDKRHDLADLEHDPADNVLGKATSAVVALQQIQQRERHEFHYDEELVKHEERIQADNDVLVLQLPHQSHLSMCRPLDVLSVRIIVLLNFLIVTAQIVLYKYKYLCLCRPQSCVL